MSIESRIRRAETEMGMRQEPVIVEIVNFGDGPMPPERREGNYIVRTISYREHRQHLEGGAHHGD